MITVIKVLNSSVVLVEQDGVEKIVLGKGIGYGKKIGDSINDEYVDKIFLENNIKTAYITELVKEVPFEFFEITRDIIQLAETHLNKKLDNNIYLTLADHIYFSVERVKKGLFSPNKLYWEIKNYYPDEFSISEKALKILSEKYNLCFPEEEASNIAFHLINAQSISEENRNAFRYAKMISSIVNMVKYTIGSNIDISSIHYTRFITHVRFFVERLCSEIKLQDDNEQLYNQMLTLYPFAMDVADNIKQFVMKTYNLSISNDEIVYLGIHINRLIRNSK